MKKYGLVAVLAVMGFAVLTTSGCAGRFSAFETISGEQDLSAATGYSLRPLDPIEISLLGIPDEKMIDAVIDEKGKITLPFIDEPIQAAGLTATALQREIQRIYIEEQIYRSITVNVLTYAKTYFMEGEVRRPQEYPLTRRITLLQAIAAAGDYTEYANPRNITVTRGGRVFRVNARELERNPERDIVIEAGDRIRVGRSIY